MEYKPKNYSSLLGIPGFSDTLLKNHFTLYEGYVKNANLLADKFAQMEHEGKNNLPEYAELKRRFGWEFNGMRLHEYYFDNLTKSAAELENAELLAKIRADFGEFELWKKDFLALGAMRGIGWVLLVYDAASDRLMNLWVNEHDLGLCAGTAILLVMDVFEHAYMVDYGLKKEDYLNAFMKAVHWKEAQNRFHEILVTSQAH